jgi:bleomycin hydrolase
MNKFLLSLIAGLFVFPVLAQQPKDKAIYKVYKEGYFEKYILSGIEDFEKKDVVAAPVRSFKVDMSGLDIPNSKDLYKTLWHNEPVSQGNTGSCWCFSGTSYLETEVFRLTGQKVKLSEMYTVYWEYVEKTRRFIEKRGNSLFDEGAECNAVIREWKKYGIVPAADYNGLLPGQVYHNHEAMVKEMTSFLNSLKETNNWNEELAVSTIRSILDHYMGRPPQTIKVNGKDLSPQQYLKDVIAINLDDQVNLLSLMQQPYWEKVVYEVPDNWWLSNEYHNVPLVDFMVVVKKALKMGHTFTIGGDVSEAGMDAKDFQAAIVPTFDIPGEYIDDYARQMRFTNGSTTDDHGMHVVGYLEKNGKTWFLVKDSGAGSKTGGREKNKNFGYYFFHEDYIKLKMMEIVVHKDVVKDLLVKFKQ